MDPLSVSASVVGILGAATKVSSVLYNFVQNAKGAPKLAQTVLAEVNGLSTALGHLQTYILGLATSSQSRASLILVEQVIVTLADCVTTFSELEAVLGTARVESELCVLDRVKWASKESKVADIQRRLQSNKSSLTLMLTILSCKSNQEAESATSRLCDLVEQVLAENREMRLRLRNLDNVINSQAQSKEPERNRDASIISSWKRTTTHGSPEVIPEGVKRNKVEYAFEKDLLASRVYRKHLFSKSGDPLVTSAARTTAWSFSSGISLTDVSNISILSVPIYAHEISNSARYMSGDFQAARLAVEDLGVVYVSVAAILPNGKGQSAFDGWIPLFVIKPGELLKEKATEVEDIFNISGSARRLQVAEAAFYDPPKYGRGFDWTGYTVHDTACTLLMFLFRLPEPVIPFDCYEAFHDPLKDEPWCASMAQQSAYTQFDHAPAIHEYRRLIIFLPSLSRTLLIYLLDLLVTFALKSEINKMTSQRLAAIFQPAILSPVKAGEDFDEKAESCQLSQMVLAFLIEGTKTTLRWDSLDGGMSYNQTPWP